MARILLTTSSSVATSTRPHLWSRIRSANASCSPASFSCFEFMIPWTWNQASPHCGTQVFGPRASESPGLRRSGQQGPRTSAPGPKRAQVFGARASGGPGLRRLGRRGPRTSAARLRCADGPTLGPAGAAQLPPTSAASVAALTAPAASLAGNCAVPMASPPLSPRELPCCGCPCAAKPEALAWSAEGPCHVSASHRHLGARERAPQQAVWTAFVWSVARLPAVTRETTAATQVPPAAMPRRSSP